MCDLHTQIFFPIQKFVMYNKMSQKYLKTKAEYSKKIISDVLQVFRHTHDQISDMV